MLWLNGLFSNLIIVKTCVYSAYSKHLRLLNTLNKSPEHCAFNWMLLDGLNHEQLN